VAGDLSLQRKSLRKKLEGVEQEFLKEESKSSSKSSVSKERCHQIFHFRRYPL
jgi:hypothetical protein